MSNLSNQSSSLLSSLKKLLLNNWPSKLLSLVLALILWTFLITQDETLTREYTFTDVTINVAGETTMKNNGFIVVSNLGDVLKNATVRVDVPQGVYNDVQPSSYNVRIDLTRINKAGAQEVKVLATNSAAFGTVKEITPAYVSIVVEEYAVRSRIPVVMLTTGEVPEGFALSSSALNPTVVSVSGPKSIVDNIVRAEALVDLGMLPAREGATSNAVPFNLIDRDGNVVESDLLTVTMDNGKVLDSMVVNHSLVSKRVITLSDLNLVTGTPANGYQILDITFTPSEVVATGMQSDLDALRSLFTGQSVDVTGLTESTVEVIRLRKPTEINLLKPDSVTVSVEIGPKTVSRTFSDLPITVLYVGNGLDARYERTKGSVTVTGPYNVVSSLQSSQISLVCNAGNLGVGTYEMPVMCRVNDASASDLVCEVTSQPLTVQLIAR